MAETSDQIRLSGLSAPRDFSLRPDGDARATLAADLGVSAIRKLSFEGRLRPEGTRDWRLDASLGATVVQPCVVTDAPVTTRIDETVLRRYVADFIDPAEGSETEMPEDDSIEPLPATLDLSAVMAEALSLALPDFPRAPGVDPVSVQAAEPGVEPMQDEDAKPFAALKDLRDKLSKKGN